MSDPSPEFCDAAEPGAEPRPAGVYETPGATPDFRTELARQLAELVPEAVADGKINVAKLQSLLEDDAEKGNERFGLSWPGKRAALRAAQAPTTATLRPDKANSKDWETTENVFIEGDNLEVLKILQKHYHNRIKLIYIDPPYNTGKDFVYPDNYKEGLATYLQWTQQVNEEGRRVSTNSETEGRFHSNWLNMMYPRLKLARNLLTDDGVIFISIDDNEVDNLRKLCNEVFGESNFQGHIHWRRRSNQPNDATKLIGLVAEHVLVFSKNGQCLTSTGVGKLPLSGKFGNPDNDPRGPWNSKPWKVGSGQSGSRYLITSPTGSSFDEEWMGEIATFQKLVDDNRIVFPNGGSGPPRKKIFMRERAEEGQCATNWFPHEAFGSNQRASGEVEAVFDGRKGLFTNPKPTQLLAGFARIGGPPCSNYIALDFFAGSGTLAHAVMQLNAEDGGNRRCISVQLPEPTPEASPARAAGYLTISEIARERIRRAGAKIVKEQEGRLSDRDKPLDVGFRAYKLADTNFAKWQVSSETAPTKLAQHLLDLKENSLGGATPEDLLTEILLKQGFSLTVPIQPATTAGLNLFLIGRHTPSEDTGETEARPLAVAYLDAKVKPNLDQLRAVVKLGAPRLIILEDAFNGDDELKTNLTQTCKSAGIDLWTA